MRNDLILRDNEKGRLGALPAAGHSFTKFIFVGHVCKLQTMKLKKPKSFPASKALKVKNQLTTQDVLDLSYWRRPSSREGNEEA